jgi:hypothetical protein
MSFLDFSFVFVAFSYFFADMNQRVTYPDLEQGARLSGYNTGELKNGLPAPRGYNDVCFAILFWAHVIAVIGLAVYGGKAMNDANNLDPVMKMKMMVREACCVSRSCVFLTKFRGAARKHESTRRFAHSLGPD